MGTLEIKEGNMIYIIKHPQFTHKRHLNQIRKCLSYDNSSPSEMKEVMDVIDDTFDMPIPQAALEQHHLKTKRKMSDLLSLTQRYFFKVANFRKYKILTDFEVP